MIIYPAIDLRGGNCVRLLQGDFDKTTVFSDNPLQTAEKWASCGASWLHLVDLDGARQEQSDNRRIICEIATKLPVSIQTGGGIRTMADIDELLSHNVSRVILGTIAVKDPDFVARAVEKYGDKIAVGIDAKDGFAAISGWEAVSDRKAIDLAVIMKGYGVKHIIYTDIATDGMLTGPNLSAMTEMSKIFGPGIIASGGVGSFEDLQALTKSGVSGAIVGKALYTGAVDLKEAVLLEKEG
ncbi:MAG: 1-(5-phosphoribosyl)-5-[(5-phosphoribosylamino)methylideneamino]imidazole-4-carboxamide isomerase [Ruminococcaceae bacterium]|nr:1-(5-phosphoribosyl)-5-[(5-phosphoribosylamino)methylideneamino]imidazole-4-carboxamide isomerase [Oscillospiraceae bacterium]